MRHANVLCDRFNVTYGNVRKRNVLFIKCYARSMLLSSAKHDIFVQYNIIRLPFLEIKYLYRSLEWDSILP